MKKLLAIMVLGLLLSGNAFAKAKLGIHFKNDNMIIIESSNGIFGFFWGSSSKEIEKNLDKATSVSKDHCNIYSKKTYLFRGYNLEDNEQDRFFGIKGRGEFDIITSPAKYHRLRFICANNIEDAKKILKNHISNNEFATINNKDYLLYSLDGWRAEKFKKVPETQITEKPKKQEPKKKKANSFWNFNKKKKVVQASPSNEDPKITKAKKACRDLGFKPRSERFTDCALKLVMLDFERTTNAKNEPQVIINKNVSDTNIFDELGVLFRQQGIIQDTSRPANTRNNIRCTSTTTKFGQVITNCR